MSPGTSKCGGVRRQMNEETGTIQKEGVWIRNRDDCLPFCRVRQLDGEFERLDLSNVETAVPVGVPPRKD